MNYIGSKHKLLNFIEASIGEVTGGSFVTLCDIFAGTGSVGRLYKSRGKSIVANDIQYYSYVLNRNYIGNHITLNFEGLNNTITELKNEQHNKNDTVCNYLDKIKGIKGFIFNNYCLGGSSDIPRMYYSDNNGMRCDAIRQQIEDWHINNLITENEYYFLLASLLESIDKVANTASVYGAFLKSLKKTAQKDMILQPANFFLNDNEHTVYNEDANSMIKKVKTDILYLDPPYNHRQYNANYHLLETIAKYDYPNISGKTGLRKEDNTKSLYCSKKDAFTALSHLIQNADAKYIFLSYNNEGILSIEEIKQLLSSRGEYGVFKKEYTRYKADVDGNRIYSANNTTEYLHYVKIKD